jgi:hypothetical protein
MKRYIHPRLAAEKHEITGRGGETLLTPKPQVIIYMPDNGRDPDLVKGLADPRIEANTAYDRLVRPDGEDQQDG